MKEIICPNCKKAFKIDEAGYADILKQVRDENFVNELHERLQMAEKDKLNAVKLSEEKIKNQLQANIYQKDSEIAKLQLKLDAISNEKENAIDLAKETVKNQLQSEISEKNAEILKLKTKLENAEIDKKLTLTEAVNKIEKERDELKIKLSSEELDKQRIESSLKDKYETQIKDREDTIERLKDMKAKLSVKLVGENLEQHCQNEFNNVRAGMFPFAFFDKDNEAVEGTKGDYIYRDYESQGGIEIVSIMFEMKDEQDTSINKKTIESHLKKLDEDRRKKRCEYAILVTLLESDNELYNRGIVDVSYKYEKMFVIRPQFFLPLISLLKNAGLKSAEDKRQLAIARNSNIDIENFVGNMESWKNGWSNNMKNAYKKHSEAIDQINKAIRDLEKVRDALTTSDKHLLAAENKMEDLTIKRLTKNAPSVADRFKELEG